MLPLIEDLKRLEKQEDEREIVVECSSQLPAQDGLQKKAHSPNCTKLTRPTRHSQSVVAVKLYALSNVWDQIETHNLNFFNSFPDT